MPRGDGESAEYSHGERGKEVSSRLRQEGNRVSGKGQKIQEARTLTMGAEYTVAESKGG
jgi:hypothetical protein